MSRLAQSLQDIESNPDALAALARLQRGIEKESLRVTPNGGLSTQPHPEKLGSALTHPSITTDFSEAQLELITGVHETPEDCLAELQKVHSYVFEHIEDELLWPASMPCVVADDEHIPVGRYGTSNIGMAKTVYRRGLGVRYGRLMQTISGIHYNFSIPDELWPHLGIHDQDQKTAAYFGLIRNFRRWSWLLLYTYGASPAVCKSFTNKLDHALEELDEGSHYLPHATSLRMGPLGYQSNAQTQLHISYNSLDAYADSMVEALTTSYPAYEQAGVLDANGEYQQLNTSILQIENEFYGTIRPKRTINKGERPVTALRDRGVEYVEVRCIDLNPFAPLGIDAEQIRFLDTFLIACLLADSPDDDVEESMRLSRNQLTVVEQGRDPEVELEVGADTTTKLRAWAGQLLDECMAVAEVMDKAEGGDLHQSAVKAQLEKIADANATPSARSLAQMSKEQIPFFRFVMNQAIANKQGFAQSPLAPEVRATMEDEARASVTRQIEAENEDSRPFPEFLSEYISLPD